MDSENLVVVDISDFRVCKDPTQTLITYSLGSCIAFLLYDPVRRIGGMLHSVLPLAQVSAEKAARRPAMFTDRGVPLLIELMLAQGAKKGDLRSSVIGAGILIGSSNLFNIGQRNFTALRKVLWRNDMLLDAEDVGGSRSRTVALHVGTGKVVVRSQGNEVELI